MRVAITGASGLIGRALAEALEADGHEILPLVRPSSRSGGAASGGVRWDPDAGTIEAGGLEGVDAVVHLAGASIGGGRWTAARKRLILESRTKGTDLLARSLTQLDRPPRVLVSASAIGYYGNRGDEVLTETSSNGDDFPATVATAWEEATGPAREAGIRVVCARSGIVLSQRGGALPRMIVPFRFGLGGPMGSGRQWMSWISLDDEVGALRFLLDHDDIAGPVNLVAPTPVTNRQFAKTLGRVLRRPAVLPVPSFGPRLLLGRELADALLFVSQRVEPSVLTETGYTFAHPTLDPALRAVLGR